MAPGPSREQRCTQHRMEEKSHGEAHAVQFVTASAVAQRVAGREPSRGALRAVPTGVPRLPPLRSRAELLWRPLPRGSARGEQASRSSAAPGERRGPPRSPGRPGPLPRSTPATLSRDGSGWRGNGQIGDGRWADGAISRGRGRAGISRRERQRWRGRGGERCSAVRVLRARESLGAARIRGAAPA